MQRRPASPSPSASWRAWAIAFGRSSERTSTAPKLHRCLLPPELLRSAPLGSVGSRECPAQGAVDRGVGPRRLLQCALERPL
eukprot:8747096-Alexandrium_andersonii.AAC.1